MEPWVCYNNVLNAQNVFHSAQSHSKTSPNKFKKKQWKKQPWTLPYILVFQTTSFSFSSNFWSRIIKFLYKMMPCKYHLKLSWLGFGSSYKDVGSNLWLLTDKITSFCWTFPLGPSYKAPLRIHKNPHLKKLSCM
jgi:hypothetical protein